jgi:two-component system, LuxR family, sensor kinase FixL
MMRTETPGAFGTAVRWTHVPAWVLIVSLVGFVRVYLQAGRLWLAWTVCGLRTLSLILNFVCTPNLNYREITALGHVSLLGRSGIRFHSCKKSSTRARQRYLPPPQPIPTMRLAA